MTSQVGSDTLIYTQPLVVADDDWLFSGTEHLAFVPENRLDPTSRMIALSFITFPAKESSSLSPVAFLGAGPGEPYSAEVFFQGRRAEAWRWELEKVNQKRDVILINQRGNSESPGLPIHNFRYKWNNGGELDRAFSRSRRDSLRRAAYQEAIQSYTDSGIDLAGYNFTHVVDDIETVRKILGYDKLALIANSFGSQWGLGYIQRYPEYVDRALFSGVEPLDHNYDDPQEIWKVLERIEQEALEDADVAEELPEVGLINAFKKVIERLEASPQKVHLKLQDEEIDVVVGADDLRFAFINPKSRTYADDAASWPKYITEMYNGDYRYLADLSRGRVYNSSSRMIDPLFNNSLGISKERDAILKKRPAARYLGDINAHYTATRDICPAPKVEPSFRVHRPHDIPVVIIQGDMDTNTPYGNASFLMDYLQNGHLIIIKRGFHNAKRALIFGDRKLATEIYKFMDTDFEKASFQEFIKTLPDTYELPKFEFWPIGGRRCLRSIIKMINLNLLPLIEITHLHF